MYSDRHTSSRRWQSLVVAIAALFALVIAGCSSASKDSTTPSGAAPSAGAGAGAVGAGGTLTVDTSFIIQSMDPARNVTPTLSVINSGVYQTLLKAKNGSSTPEPLLAESVKASTDAKVYTFTLRSDVKFSDGTPMTSADVLFSFNRLKNIKAGGSYLTDGLTFTAPDAKTFVITSAEANPAIPAIVMTPAFTVLNSKAVKAAAGTDAADAATADKADAWFGTNSAGSGPYILSSYRTNDSAVLTRNTNYWGTDKPHFDRVVIRNMPAATQLLNVQRGSNEVALDLSAAQGTSLKGNSAVQVSTTPSPSVFRIQLNMNSAASQVSSNPHIQKAIRYGLNYDAITQLGGEGSGRAAGLLPTAINGSLPQSDAIKQDIPLAKSEVAASGISNPTLKITYPSDIDLNGIKFGVFAQRVKADLEGVGITVNLDGVPVSTYLTQWRTGKMEATVTYSYPDYLDSSSLLSYLPGGSDGVRAGWNKGADPAMEQEGTKLLTTTDEAARAQVASDIQKKLVTEGPYITMVQTSQTIVGSKGLTGVALSPTWTFDVTLPAAQ